MSSARKTPDPLVPLEVVPLLDRDLTGFRIVIMTEVFKKDEDGRRSKSLGFFKNQDVAEAFADIQTDSAWHKTEQHAVLTDGKVALLFDHRAVHLMDDEQEALNIREAAAAKLTPAQRKVLRI